MTGWIEMSREGEREVTGWKENRGAEGEGTLSFKLTQCSVAGQ